VSASKKNLLQTIKSLIYELSEAEADEVAALLKLRAQYRPAPVVQARDDDWLLRGVVVVLRKRGLISPNVWPTAEAIKRVAPAYPKTSAVARQVLTTGLELDAPRCQVLGTLAADALATWLEDRRAPVSFKTMLINVANVPEAFDHSYPGYLECGMVGALVP